MRQRSLPSGRRLTFTRILTERCRGMRDWVLAGAVCDPVRQVARRSSWLSTRAVSRFVGRNDQTADALPGWLALESAGDLVDDQSCLAEHGAQMLF